MTSSEASVLVSLANSTVSALHDGALTQLAHGQVSLAIGDLGDGDQALILICGELEFVLPARMTVMRQGANRIAWPASADEPGSGYIVVDLGGSEDERETFESVLSSWTSFEDTEEKHKGKLVLVDEKTGGVVAEVDGKVTTTDGTDGKDPVIVEANAAGDLSIAPLRASYGQSGSRLIGGAETVSRGVLYVAEKIGASSTNAAARYTSTTPVTDSPIKFSPVAERGFAGAQTFTSHAVRLSGKTVGALAQMAEQVGGTVGKTLGIQKSPTTGKAPTGIRGGVNKGLIAFNTVWDSLDAGGKHILATTSAAGTSAIGHKYGPDAGTAFKQATDSVTGVALVYVDVRGVSKRALLKAAGKSAVRAKLPDGRVVELRPDSVSQAGSGATTPVGGKA